MGAMSPIGCARQGSGYPSTRRYRSPEKRVWSASASTGVIVASCSSARRHRIEPLGMKIRTNTFDLWIFHRRESEPRYLLFFSSPEKADAWFGGHRFWQTAPGGMIREGEEIQHAFARVLRDLDLTPKGVWAAEYTYTIWNLKRAQIGIA